MFELQLSKDLIFPLKGKTRVSPLKILRIYLKRYSEKCVFLISELFFALNFKELNRMNFLFL